MCSVAVVVAAAAHLLPLVVLAEAVAVVERIYQPSRLLLTQEQCCI
jgi:hypothetical protein